MLYAVYDEASESWKLNDSYGLSFVGRTSYDTEEMPGDGQQTAILENIFDTAEIAEAFLTKNFYKDTDKQYMDFYTVETTEAGDRKSLNTDLLLAVKPEFREILCNDDPVQSIKNLFSICFTPAFAAKFSVHDMFSYDEESGKLYVSEQEILGFLDAAKERYRVAEWNDDRIVLLTYKYEPRLYGEDDIHYRYVYIIKHEGQWKLSESVMVNSALHVPDNLILAGSGNSTGNKGAERERELEAQSENPAISAMLEMTFGELLAGGNIETISYYESGSAPVCQTGDEGIYLIFPAVTDNTSAEAAEKEIMDKFPVKILIRSENAEPIFGLKVGMDAAEANAVISEWNDVHMSSENSLYYTTYAKDSVCLTAAWEIPDELFSEWVNTISDEADYYAEFLKFIEPFKKEPVGKIAELAIEKMD